MIAVQFHRPRASFRAPKFHELAGSGTSLHDRGSWRPLYARANTPDARPYIAPASLAFLTNDLVLTPFSLPPARDDHLRRCRLPFSRSPKYPPHHHSHAQHSRGLILIGATFFCPRTTTIFASPLRLPGQEHSHMPNVLPAHTGSQTRGAAGMRSARGRPRLNPQEAIVATSLRGATTCRSVSPPRWSVTYAIRRDYQQRRLLQGTVYGTTTLRAIATRLRTCHTLRAMYCEAATSPHARYSVPDVVPHGHARYQASAHSSPDLQGQPHGQRVALAFFVPHAAFVASPVQCDRHNKIIALTARRSRLPRSSVPPATRPASAARATVVPRRRHCLRRFLTPHHHPMSSPLDARG
ncbi:hypothetical protein K438DRAFT_2020881 [Mycena galopus ATCC 62051]|nr:hypothetical protein K438DRAFT_2020881 [Mycena galopus ATCC 62051]